jgi:hypothetical protein
MSRGDRPAADALGSTAPLAASLELPLLGVPVRYRSNSPAVIAAAEQALGRWRELPAALLTPGPPLAVDIVVHPPDPAEPAAPPDSLVLRAHGDTVLAAGGGSLMTADLARGAALSFVTPDLAADEPSLRRRVLERLGLLLLSRRDRAPLGAAGMVLSGTAVLLAGAGGADRSTLCYACVRAGFALLAEDSVCVSLAGGLRVWGHAGPLALPPDAARLFPELAPLRPQAGPGGEPQLVVDVAGLGQGRLATHAERAVVCVVERAAGQASRLEPLPAADAAARLADSQGPGLDLPGARAAAAAAVAAGGAYRLAVGSDPNSAALLLAHLAGA